MLYVGWGICVLAGIFVLWLAWEFGRAILKERARYRRTFRQTSEQWERNYFSGS